MPSRSRRALPYAVAGLVFLGFLLLLCWRLWTPIDGARRSFGWDAQWEYWGDLQFEHDALADGELPLWNPFDRTGYPFHADPQAGLFYPPNWVILAGAGMAGGVPHIAVTVKVLLHFWLACFGLFVYLRRRGVHTAACYVGGTVFIVGYPFLHNLFSAINWNIAWCPWVLLAIDLWSERPTRARAALVALTGSMCALAGGPASFWYSLLIAVPYAAWSIAHHAGRQPAARRDYLGAVAVSGAAAAGLMLAVVAVQFRSTFSVVGDTVRESRDLDFITHSTFGVDDIAGFVIPRMLGGNTYLGAATVVWAALSLTAFFSPRRMVLAGVAAAGMALALGQNAEFLGAAASAFEPFGLFRRAHRYLYVVQLPVAILAAEGLDQLIRLDSDELRQRIARGIWALGGIAVVVFGIGFAVSQQPNTEPQPLRDAFVLACISFAVTTWLTLMLLGRGGRWKSGFAWAAAIFVAGDLWFAHARHIEDGMHPPPETPRDREVTGLEGVPLAARIYDRNYLKFRPGIRLHIRDLGGYEDDPLALARYQRVLDRARKAPRLLGHLNVGWLFEARDRALRGDRKGLSPVRKGVSRVGQVAPEVLWVDRAIAVDSAGAAADALFSRPVGSAAIVERGTLTDGDLARAERGDAAAATVAGRLVELERNRLLVEIDAPTDGVVVVHEAYAPGWRAWVDGSPASIFPANAAFRGVLVGAGHHRIEMEYQPPGWQALALVSLLGLVGSAVVASSPMWRRRAGS